MRKWLWIVGIAMVLVGLIVVGYRFQWTGFQTKTLWDWLGVLAIPVVVGLGAAWYTAQQGKVSDRENTDNQREAALQAYIDKMSELLLEKNLRQSAVDDEVRNVARMRTLTVLWSLDPPRKRSVLEFLFESSLIHAVNGVIGFQGPVPALTSRSSRGLTKYSQVFHHTSSPHPFPFYHKRSSS